MRKRKIDPNIWTLKLHCECSEFFTKMEDIIVTSIGDYKGFSIPSYYVECPNCKKIIIIEGKIPRKIRRLLLEKFKPIVFEENYDAK